jgi:hypothetical protein
MGWFGLVWFLCCRRAARRDGVFLVFSYPRQVGTCSRLLPDFEGLGAFSRTSAAARVLAGFVLR